MQFKETEKDLDHKQEKTDVIAKAEKPDRNFMDSESLCHKCHGPLSDCQGDCSE
jgi:tetrahydromethanopterin S-methyltransferase subunit E